MPAGQGFLGRSTILKVDGVAIAGVREKALSVNGEPVDVTADDSAGWREVLAETGEQQVDLSLSGVTKSNVLKVIAFSKTDKVKAVTLEYADGGIVAGDFYFGPYNETGPYNDATTFEQSLVSSGPVTYTP